MVIALKEKSRVYMASDSAHIDGNQIWYNKQKIWSYESNQQVLVGGEGDPYVMQQVKRNQCFYAETPDESNVYQYMNLLMLTYPNKEWAFFIGENAKVFLINNKGLLVEIEGYEAIGPGREAALATLAATATHRDNPEYRLKLAISNSIKHNTLVNGNIKIEMV